MRRLAVPLVAVAIVVAATAITSSPSSAPARATEPGEGRYVFSDRTAGTSFAVNLDQSDPRYGLFSMSVLDVGIYYGDGPASISTAASGATVVEYTGTGVLDEGAVVDPLFGLDLPSGVMTAASFDLNAELGVDRVTGSFELVHAGTSWEGIDSAPTGSPDAATEAVLDALQRQDWSSLYDLSYSGLRSALDRAAYVAMVGEAWSGRGVVTSVAVTVPPALVNQRAGFDVSRGVVLFVLTKDSIPTTNLADVTLLWEASSWRLVSLELRP